MKRLHTLFASRGFKVSSLVVATGLVAGLFMQALVGAAPPAYVQSAGASANGSSTTIAKAFSTANVAGNMIVAAVSWSDTATTSPLTCSDSKANTYTTVVTQLDSTSGKWIGVCYAPNIKAGTNTVTARFSASRSNRRLIITEYSGLATAGAVDVTAKNVAAGTTATNGVTSTAATTTASGELIYGATMITATATSVTAGTGFTQRASLNNKDLVTQDMLQASAGSVASTMTEGTVQRYEAVMVAFRAALDTTPPSAPTNLSGASSSSTQTSLSWTASTDNVGVTGYQVERCQGTGCSNFVQVGTPATTSFNDSNLAPSTTYLYRVRATDAAGNLSSYSNTATVTTQGTPDTTPPSVPTGLSGNGTSVSQISLSWTASTDNTAVTGYKVFRNGTQVGTSTGTTFNDSGLAVNTSYAYTVSAFDAAGNNSAQSSPAVSVSTLPDTTAPSVPTNLSATPASSTQVNLSWTASTDNVGVTGYKVYRGGSLINTGTATNFQDTGLTAGTTYSYTVSAIDAAGNESVQSAAVQATTPVPDTTPPVATMSAPANGSTVSGTVTVSANATDNVGVHDVEFLLDGVTINDDTTAPYSFQWDTTTTSNGIHHLAARAHDSAGNFGLTSGSFTVQVNNQAPQLPVDLMAGWPFSESTGTTTADVTSYGNNATFTSLTEPVWTAGHTGSGMKFDGAATSYLTVNDSPTMDITGTALTLSMWMNPAGGQPGDGVVFGKFWNGASGSPHYQYGLEYNHSGNVSFYIGTTSNTMIGATMGTTIPTNQWSHLAVVFNGLTCTFYLNGNQINSAGLAGSIADRLGSTIRIGNDIDGSQGFKGSLDDIRLYKRAEAQADIQADMSQPLIGSTNSTGPSVAITAPTQNQQVSSIFTVTADASDAAGVQFFVDGTAIGAEDTVAPYAVNWDTRASSNGAHVLTARARDANGNTTVSNPITANVANDATFQNQILATGFTLPTALKFLPDGRMMVSELGGKIWTLNAPYTAVNPVPFLTLTDVQTSSTSQEGIFDFALDPNFSTNHYFYVFYSVNNGHDRLARFTANATLDGTVAGSMKVFYEDTQQIPSDEHHGGGIAFDGNGHIFVAIGEHFEGTPAQDLSSPWGKVHRYNMDGSIPTDNPFYDGAGPNVDSIYALGLRNPYRMTFDPATNRLLVGDVGGNDGTTAYEEVDNIVAGANYGWPNCEFGTCGNPAYTPALYAYPHLGRDACITGGFVYHATGNSGDFPAGFEGSYFYGDYAQNWIKRLTFDTQGNVSSVNNFEPPDGVLDGPYGDIVYLTEGPDGSLYYLDLGYSDISGTFGTSKIRNIRYQSANQAPSAVANADVTSGPTPLTVNFNSNGSTDPEGQPLTYSWDFGDGTALSTAANPTHTFTAAGVYTVRLTVSDGVNSTFSPPITIQVGSPPTATITAPVDGSIFLGGDVINFSGDGSDPDDGALPDSAFTWNVDFLHDTHVHPGPVYTGVRSGTFTIPVTGHDFSGNTRYRFTLTVTDSTGLKTVKTVTIWPHKVNLTFNTAPQGVTLYLDGIAKATPFVYDTLTNFQHTIEARNTTSGSTSYTFASWSDGGAQSHTIVVPAADASYTATYTVTNTAAGPVAAWGFNEASGTTAADASGSGNTATLVGGITHTAGPSGHSNALTFSGSGQYLTVPNSTSLDIAGSNLTLSMWINPSSGTSDSVLLGKFWNSTMTSPYYQYGVELDAGKTPHFYIGSGTNLLGAAMGSPLTLGTWSHLAIVFNGSTVSFYVNGNLVSSPALNGTITARGQQFRLGADNNTQQFFKGSLDDVRIYNRALAASEVQTDMNTAL